MLVDKMHSAAIDAADKSGLPMTVYHYSGKRWGHHNAVTGRDMLRDAKAYGVTLVITWLPVNYFNV